MIPSAQATALLIFAAVLVFRVEVAGWVVEV
jgi:hypothetical protein